MAKSSHKDKTLWDKEKLLVQAISAFPSVFSKDLYSGHIKIRACLGKS